uniref:Tryptophan synthase alpha chain n=1 Tax=Flintiella sanguinaria TaxID=101926 RepID=A0A1X9PU86_9RHOD|nr:tryptophan synthase alpha subunit [Flintiella sanguinaria]
MNNISTVFERLKSQCAFIPFITAGYPNLKITEKAIQILDNEGADIIELGLPYSDPLADGPVIQEASSKALINGVRNQEIFSMLARLIPSLKAPIILFSYYNPILSMGPENFLRLISKIGVKGLLIPDLPLEESQDLLIIAKEYRIELIMLIAPTSPINRIKAICEISQGCIYLVSSNGVTGSRKSFAINIQDIIVQIKNITNLPIIIGFGISKVEQIQEVKSLGIEGIVMGSAFVSALSSDKDIDLANFQLLSRSSKQAISLY